MLYPLNYFSSTQLFSSIKKLFPLTAYFLNCTDDFQIQLDSLAMMLQNSVYDNSN